MADADAAIKLLAPCDYDQRITLCDGIDIRFTDVGHLLGSAAIEMWITEGDISKKDRIFRRCGKSGSADYQGSKESDRSRLYFD